MARLSPLPIEHTPELREHFNFFVGTLGFVPNSVLTMQRRPKLVKALAALNGAVELQALLGPVAGREF